MIGFPIYHGFSFVKIICSHKLIMKIKWESGSDRRKWLLNSRKIFTSLDDYVEIIFDLVLPTFCNVTYVT